MATGPTAANALPTGWGRWERREGLGRARGGGEAGHEGGVGRMGAFRREDSISRDSRTNHTYPPYRMINYLLVYHYIHRCQDKSKPLIRAREDGAWHQPIARWMRPLQEGNGRATPAEALPCLGKSESSSTITPSPRLASAISFYTRWRLRSSSSHCILVRNCRISPLLRANSRALIFAI
jgi:hypothetical protein